MPEKNASSKLMKIKAHLELSSIVWPVMSNNNNNNNVRKGKENKKLHSLRGMMKKLGNSN